MAKKKKESAIDEAVLVTGELPVDQQSTVEQPSATYGRFVDVQVTEQSVPIKLSDERKLEIAERACEKHRSAFELKAEIKAYAEARKDLIKGFEKEAAYLDDQFYRGTEMLTKEVRIVKDFSAGRLRVEVIETGEVVEDREFLPEECQRDFSAMLEADPSDQLLQRTVTVLWRHIKGETDPKEFAGIIAETLGVSISFGERMIEALKYKDVLIGKGTEEDPFTIKDAGISCDHCRHGDVCDEREECDDCVRDDAHPKFEPADKCSGCRFLRQLRTFEPCTKCKPNSEASGFAEMPME